MQSSALIFGLALDASQHHFFPFALDTPHHHLKAFQEGRL
jgi:hypothetical protein